MSVYNPVQPTQDLNKIQDQLQNIGNTWLPEIPKPIDVLSGQPVQQSTTGGIQQAAQNAGINIPNAPRPQTGPNPNAPTVEIGTAYQTANLTTLPPLPNIGNQALGNVQSPLAGIQQNLGQAQAERAQNPLPNADFLRVQAKVNAGINPTAQDLQILARGNSAATAPLQAPTGTNQPGTATPEQIQGLAGLSTQVFGGTAKSQEDYVIAQLQAGHSVDYIVKGLTDEIQRKFATDPVIMSALLTSAGAIAGIGIRGLGIAQGSGILGTGTRLAADLVGPNAGQSIPRFALQNVASQFGANAGSQLAQGAGVNPLVGSVAGAIALGGLSQLGAKAPISAATSGGQNIDDVIREMEALKASGQWDATSEELLNTLKAKAANAVPTPAPPPKSLADAAAAAGINPNDYKTPGRLAKAIERARSAQGQLPTGGKITSQQIDQLLTEMGHAQPPTPAPTLAEKAAAAGGAKDFVAPGIRPDAPDLVLQSPSANGALIKSLNELPADHGLLQQALNEAEGAVGIPRTIKANFDFSAPGRQGWRLALSHPKEWVASWAPMFKAWASEGKYNEINQAIKDNPLFDVMDKTMHFYDVGPNVAASERVPGFSGLNKSFLARLAEKIPGVGRSERAYATFLNWQKMKTFETIFTNYRESNSLTPQRIKALGEVIDHATGYGARITGAQGVFNPFFAERYLTSTFQFMLDPFFQTGARQEAARNLAAFAAGNMALLGLFAETGSMTGLWSVNFDPRSGDFGKIKVGNTRFDPWSGMAPIFRLAAREATGQGVSQAGNVYNLQRPQELVNFFRNKTNPVVGMLIDQISGTNAIGQKTPAVLSPQTLANLFEPLLLNDVRDAFSQSGGNPLITALAGTGSAFGTGVTSYSSPGSQYDKVAQQLYGKTYQTLYPSEKQAVRDQLNVPQSSLQQAKAAGVAPINAQQDQAETAFINGSGLQKSLPDQWSTFNNERYGASLQFAQDYKAQLSGIAQKGFDKVVQGYYDIGKLPDGSPDPFFQYPDGSTNFTLLQKWRDNYINNLSQDPGKDGSQSPFDYLTGYLNDVAGNKSAMQQDYLAAWKAADAAGYGQVPNDPQARAQFWQQNPAIEATIAYWNSGVVNGNDASLETMQAVDAFNLLNQQWGTNYQAKLSGFSTPVNQSAGTQQGFTDLYPLAQQYFNVESGKRTAWLRDHPDINAALVWMGYSSLKLQTTKARDQYLAALNRKYGTNISGELAKNAK